jgi:glycosyltransferase involved in cell wall biosynthesis
MARLSVLMGCYNPGKFLCPTLESIRSQTFQDWELIIVDDASTDGSQEVARAAKREDKRIRLLINDVNLGPGGSMNCALAEAKTRWAAVHDADDISRPDRFERQMRIAEAKPDLALVTSYLDVLSEGQIRPGPRGIGFSFELLPWFLCFYNRIGGHGQVLYSVEKVRASGCYDASNRHSIDRALWPLLIRQGASELLREPLYIWRKSAESLTAKRAFRYCRKSLAADRRTILETSGIEVSEDDGLLLRDFWMRFEGGTQDWDRAQRLLLSIASAFDARNHLPGGVGALRKSIAEGWLSLALRSLRSRSPKPAAAHVRRAAQASARRFPKSLLRFALRLASVRGRADRLL